MCSGASIIREGAPAAARRRGFHRPATQKFPQSPYFSTIGGIASDRDFHVVDASDVPIPGLFVAGTDGCQLYRETYTVMLPGSCNANNVNSVRRAGKNAAAYCMA